MAVNLSILAKEGYPIERLVELSQTAPSGEDSETDELGLGAVPAEPPAPGYSPVAGVEWWGD